MDCFDVIVVGSGPAAVFAAVGLRGRRVLMLDVGHDAPCGDTLRGNLDDLKRAQEDLFEPLIGARFESLHNLHQPAISLKLKAPRMSYVVRDAQRLTPVVGDSFGGVVSLARGGLANAWGAGAFRFMARDLDGFPISAADLASSFDEVTSRIGVSGVNADDLEPFFGRDEHLQPPIRLSPIFADLLERYGRSREVFARSGVALGRSRLAVLTRPHHGRTPFTYDSLEFFRPHDPAIYTPAYTVRELIESKAVEYRPGRLVMRYAEHDDQVEVEARNLESEQVETWRGRALCLGAGALNTTRIVLRSNNDFETWLPLLDNPMACIPFVDVRRIGAPLESRDTALAQVNVVADDMGRLVQGSLYGTSGPLRSDFLFELPLSARANRLVAKYMMPASALLMLFYARDPDPRSGVRLRPSGELEVRLAPESPHLAIEERLIRLFRRLGFLSHRSLIQRPLMGSALHFAGSLPMSLTPAPYQTDRDGRLAGARRVHIVDGACFPRLAAKNATLTIMANALRIGRRVASALA